MITTVTLNAAIDKTYHIFSFQRKGPHRVKSMFAEPGGKGNNVAKVLHTLGVPVAASGMVGGYTGRQIVAKLDSIGVDHDFIKIDQESRVCLNIVDQETGHQTEILEQGPTLNADDWLKVKEKIGQLADQSEYVILSGSLPKGLVEDSYAELIQEINDRTRVVLDTSGPALQQALKAKPYMIKPNQDEIADVLGLEYVSNQDIIEAMHRWFESGIPVIVVSLGEEGAMACIEGVTYKITSANISAINPVGSGDAFTAGMVAGLVKKLRVEETLKLAAAAGAANALEEEAGRISLEHLKSLKNETSVELYERNFSEQNDRR